MSIGLVQQIQKGAREQGKERLVRGEIRGNLLLSVNFGRKHEIDRITIRSSAGGRQVTQ